MSAIKIGYRAEPWVTETMWRLSEPLADVWPESRNILVQVRPNGHRSILRGAAYQRADGEWSAVPRGSWVRCFSPLTARDRALVEREISEGTCDV